MVLAGGPGDGANDVESRLLELSPEDQGYARLRATVRRTEQDKAMDLVLGISLSGYREVKKAQRDVAPSAHIVDKRLLAWRMIRPINDLRPRNKTQRQAVRPTENRLAVHKESGIKENDRAELNEDWVSSDKPDMFLPFTGIVPGHQLV